MKSARALIVTVVLAIAVCLPVAARAQDRIYRIGLLTPYAPATEIGWHSAFEQALRERGYTRGRNISIEYRFAEGRDELLPKLVTELLQLDVDLLLTVGTPATRAAQRATRTIPVVMVTVLDPVQAGFVASLSHPGGNITGSSELSQELVPKRLELIRDAVPNASLIAVLWDPTHPANALDLRRTEDAARSLGLKVRGAAAHDRQELEKAFAEIKRWRAGALVVLTSYAAFAHLSRIVEFAKDNKLPTMYGTREGAEAGALLSYGPDIADQYRHAAAFVDKILKGDKPANLPVEQPTRFELVVNATTAKALGITIPESILVRADQVIK